jgi:uncharacterized protein (DUF1786 family)
MLTITKRSAVTGALNTMDVHITGAALIDYGNGHPLAEVAPQLTAAERRFLEHGITPEEDAALALIE